MKFADLWGKRLVFFDGAMGTMLQQAGLKGGELPELWNLEKPEVVEGIHRRYREAGCDILKTNTFGANRFKLAGTGHTVEEIVCRAVELARRGAGKDGLVALDIGPTGKLLQPLGDLAFEDAYQAFREMAQAGEKAGADCILIETFSDTYEVKAAVLAAKESTSLPVIATMIFDGRGKLLTGGDIPAAAALLEGLGVDALGFNCGAGPEQMKALLPQLLGCCALPVVVNPNAGLPRSEDGQTVFDVESAAFAASMRELAGMGLWAAGGCCGTTPAHLAAMIDACRGLPLTRREDSGKTLVSSYAHAVEIGSAEPVIIGERINPTGKSRFKQALREGDMDYILREGIAQQKNGAHILDVNVGLPEIDEPALMEQVVCRLQGVTDLPLQIDTSDPQAMERALRAYNGKPLINSVNGKAESMRTVFPLAKKYGGVVVCLTLDEDGIPETAQGRLAVARKIVETAAQYGIAKKDLLVDVLTMTVSTGQDAAKVTLEALRLVRQELGVHTVLGVSNVSFGLPQREVVNAAFYTLALHSGLDAAILNPNSAGMMNAYATYRALMGLDAGCAAYIERMAALPASVPAAVAAEKPAAGEKTPAGDTGLREAVRRGLKERAAASAAEELGRKEPMAVIEEELMPALDEVGKAFEAGTLFLPQLLMSAEAAKAAFEVLREHMSRTGGRPEKKQKVILATVKGDIHDIGKNIVKVLMENYGYDVIDLGKDVDPQVVADTAVEQDVRLVGLSALMTTTVSSMAQTIDLLRRVKPECRVVVGGAVMTQAYADQIGADCYSPDAMATVHYAQRLFGE